MIKVVKCIGYVMCVFCAVLCNACKKKTTQDNSPALCQGVPVYVDTTYNITDFALRNLTTQGYAYARGGYKGILLYKESATYIRAYERASTYNTTQGCAIVMDKSLFFFADTCSGSKYDLTGRVINGPAVCPLIEYKTFLVGQDRLRVSNQGL